MTTIKEKLMIMKIMISDIERELEAVEQTEIVEEEKERFATFGGN